MIFEIEIRGTHVFENKSISIVSIRHDNSIGYNNKRMSWNAIFIFVNSNTCYCTSFLICLYSEGSTGRFLFHFVLSKCPSELIRTFVTDPIHIKSDGTKHCARDFYLITSLNYGTKEVLLQKFHGNQLRSKQYKVKLSDIYLAPFSMTKDSNDIHLNVSDDDDFDISLENSDDDTDVNEEVFPSVIPTRRSSRIRKPPDRFY